MQNILLILITLIYTGCGESSSPTNTTPTAPVTQSTQEMLDNQDYESVVSSLEGSAFSNDEYLDLATAYLGLSGLTTRDIILNIYSTDDSQNNSFMELTNSIQNSTKSSVQPLEYLDKSAEYYMKVIGDRCTQYNERVLSDEEKTICLYKGLAQIVESVTAISYITGDVRNLINNIDDNELTTASCAMEYAFNGQSNCSFFKKEAVTFADGKTYDRVVIYSNHEEFQYLLKEDPILRVNSVIMTNGYCTLDSFGTRVQEKPQSDSSKYYVCPVNLTFETVLIDSLNEGIEAVIVGAKTDVDLIEDVKLFKEEILGSSYQRDEDITMSTLLKYFGKYTD
ncbi:MAG: hypothetical protein U9P38_00720 [Campylobacterota bacterium]|nr:hypothetical protein [Campylobacterota bacterium]